MFVIDESNADIHRRGVIGGFVVRPNGPFTKGQVIKGGKHYIDHLTYFVSGRPISVFD